MERRANFFELLKDQRPDVCMISETRLNQHHKLTNNNYIIVRRDRPNSTFAGGVAILLRKGINHKVIYSGEVRRFRVLEACIVCIPLHQGKRLYVIAIYAPPEAPQRHSIIPELETLFRCLSLNSEDNYFLMAGDYNARHQDWGNQYPNPRGTQLFNWLGLHSIEYKVDLLATDRPSYPRSGSYLDLLLMDARLRLTDDFLRQTKNCLTTVEYDSDHCGLAAVILLPDDLVELAEYVPTHSYNYGRTRWPRFSSAVSREIRTSGIAPPGNRNLSNVEIDGYLERMEVVIKSTMDRTIPKYRQLDSTNLYRNATIDALYRQKSRLLSRLKLLHRRFTDRHNLEVLTLKSQIKNLQQLIKENYKKSISSYWNNKIRAVRSNNPSMFPEINKIFRRKDQNNLQCIKLQRTTENKDLLLTVGVDPENAILDDGLFVVEDDQEKVETVGAVFERVYRVNQSVRPNDDLENRAFVGHFYLRNEISQWRSENLGFTRFNDEQLANAVVAERNGENLLVSKMELEIIFGEIKKKKSAGIDGIPNIVLRHLPSEAVDIYTTLFNNALNNAYYPVRWKTAVVHPLLKKGKDGSNPANLRSISLLPSISKVFEKVINRALATWAEDKNIIPENQYGFKAGHETTHAASKLVSDIQWNKAKNQCTGACLVDLEKAFDTVWLDGLFYKLVRYGISKPLLYVLNDMLHGRKFIVKSGNVTSTRTFSIKNGLQQGAVNSPILFSIYTSDLIGSLHHAIAYADDLIAYRTGPKIEVIRILLQRDFDKIQKYCDDWKLVINFQKSETILFRTSLARATRDTRKNWRKMVIVDSHGHPLVSRVVVKYLGIWLDQYLYFNRHMDAALARAKGAFALTRRLFHSSQLDSRVKVICYMALIRPMLSYGCPVWFNVTASQMEKIRVFERQCLRTCLSLHRTPESEYIKYYRNEVLYNEARINRVDNFIVRLIRGHVARAMTSTNGLIFGAYYPNTEYFDRAQVNGFVPPEAFLHFDMKGLIQDRSAIPLIYHVSRRYVERRLLYDRDIAARSGDVAERLRFSRAVSERDIRDTEKSVEKFWWLSHDNSYFG